MADLNLLKRSESAADLTATEHDTNFTNIETEVNARLESLIEDPTPQLGGALDCQGFAVDANLATVQTGITGTLTAAGHSGKVLVTTGSAAIVIPTVAGFHCTLICGAGASNTVSFNGTTSAAMAPGDMMEVIVESATVVHAVLATAAEKVSFT